MKKTNYIYILGLLVMSLFSCDEDTNDFVPELAPVATINITSTQSADTQCAVDITIAVMAESTLYYDILLSSADAPTSDDLFADGDELSFDGPDSSTISIPNLPEGLDLTVYAVSVNENGTRSEQVFTANYVQPSYDINIDTSYSGDVEVPLFGIGLGVFEPYTVTFTPVSGETNTYTFDTAWGPNFLSQLAGAPPGFSPYPATIVINDDLSVTVTSIEAYGSGGSGFYDPCTNIITFTIDQFFFADPNNFTTDVTLVPDNL